MPYSNPQAARSHVEKLMDIAVALADFTQADQVAERLPACLARALDLPQISLAVVRTVAGAAAPEILLAGSTGSIVAEPAAFSRLLVSLYHHSTRPTAKEISNLRISDPAIETGSWEVLLPELANFPRALVFARSIDDQTRILLTIHLSSEASRISASQLDALHHTASQLAKLLRCMYAWQANPEILGPAFERLTDREWVVLRGLNSDVGEKQLADRLSLSPHTLHSHIKSIYRKVGVQGRLPLLLRLNAALRDLRASTLQPSPVAAAHKAPPAHVETRPMVAYA